MSVLIDNEMSSNPCKILKNEIILIDDNYKITYDISSETNIFTKHFIECECPFCKKTVCQYLGEGYDKSPRRIKFEPVNIVKHIREFHSDNFISVKESKVNMETETIELILLKKIVL